MWTQKPGESQSQDFRGSRLGGSVCKVAVLCGQIRRRDVRRAANGDGALRGSVCLWISPVAEITIGVHWLCLTLRFDKHDLLSVNIHGALQQSLCLKLINLPGVGGTLQ